jgi:inorganic pyrophosphatase
MVHPWHDIPLDDPLTDEFPAFIEIPKGSKLKYELDKETGLLRVDRVLFSAVHYPANYGFIPRTYCDDGDALDVLVLGQEAVVPMCIMRARAIGCMAMHDEKGQDDKILAVHIDDPAYRDVRHFRELMPHVLSELQRFFLDYKTLEHKEVKVDEFDGPDEAIRVMRAGVVAYDSLYRRHTERQLPPISGNPLR